MSQKQKKDDRMEASCYHAIKNKLLFTEDGVKMKVIEVADRTPLLIKQLLEVWESSVRATHLFLSENEIENIKNSYLFVKIMCRLLRYNLFEYKRY